MTCQRYRSRSLCCLCSPLAWPLEPNLQPYSRSRFTLSLGTKSGEIPIPPFWQFESTDAGSNGKQEHSKQALFTYLPDNFEHAESEYGSCKI